MSEIRKLFKDVVCKDLENIILSFLDECPSCNLYSFNEVYYVKKCRCNFGNICLHDNKCGSSFWDKILICEKCIYRNKSKVLKEIQYFEMLEQERKDKIILEVWGNILQEPTNIYFHNDDERMRYIFWLLR